MVKIKGEVYHTREPFAKKGLWGRHLGLHNLRVLFVLVFRLEALPGQVTFREIDQHIHDRFQVVPPALLCNG